MRLFIFLFCCCFLISCTHEVRETWSWNSDQEIFELKNQIPAPLKPLPSPLSNRVPPKALAVAQGEGDGQPEKTLHLDLDRDGFEEAFQFANERIVVTEGDKQVWQSPEAWKVTDIILADSTRDGMIDINIAAWREENFGSSKPFWEENSTVPHHHFFVMQMRDDEIVPYWQSSNLESINQEIQIADVDGDGKNELIVMERDYGETEDCHNTALAVWRWNEWGFYHVWRGPRGDYCGLEILDGYIIVNNFDK